MGILVGTALRDLRITYRNASEVINPLIFFVIVITLFPLGIGPTEETLRDIAPGVIWVAALLATLLSLELVFKSDYEDGSLEQMLMSNHPFILIVIGKIWTHWLSTGLLLTLLSPLLALMLFVNSDGILAIGLSLLLGTPILSLIGAIGAALTVGLRKGGVLVAILILPLYIPVLILCTAMVQTGMQQGDYTGHMLWLGALLALSAGLAPVAASAGLKISLSH
ncbi:MAG: heme exporter protein CcmB [Pseudomonadales bacterium]